MRASRYQGLTRCVRLFSLIMAFSPALCGPAASQARQDGSPSRAGAKNAVATPESARGLSKFEARHIRHTCRDEANKSATPTGRKDFVSHCFQMHVSARRFTRECKNVAELRSLGKSARDEFLRACVAEKLKSFAPARRDVQNR